MRCDEGERLVREAAVRRALAKPRASVEDQWWCGGCKELRARAKLEVMERDGGEVYSCPACGRIVDALPF